MFMGAPGKNLTLVSFYQRDIRVEVGCSRIFFASACTLGCKRAKPNNDKMGKKLAALKVQLKNAYIIFPSALATKGFGQKNPSCIHYAYWPW